MYDIPMRHTPEAAMNGATRFALELVHNGGTGARPRADGLSATAYPSGVFGSQVEMTEAVAPVVIWQRQLIQDSGGAGQFRGGLGQRIEVGTASDEPFLVFLSVDRIDHPARGRAGGGDGMPGRIAVSGREETIPGKCVLRIEPGEHLTLDTPGGGGFGRASDRSAAAIQRDLDTELISNAAARDVYRHASD